MARKSRGRKTRRSRNSGAVNLVNLGASVLTANIVTDAMFNTNAWDFFFAGTKLSKAPRTAQGTNVISAWELITWDKGNPWQGAGKDAGRFDIVKDNLKENGLMAVVSLIGLGVAKKLVSKSMRPLFRQANNLLDMTPVKGMVRF